MPKQDDIKENSPIWTQVTITINQKRGSATTYWDKSFIDDVFKDKKTGLLPDMKLKAKYDKENDRICIEVEK